MAKYTVNQFIELISPYAIDTWDKYGVLPSLTIAQGILESGYGNSELAQKANNYFGIKADNRWKGKTYSIKTKEYKLGVPYYTTAKFRRYNNIRESVEDKGLFLQADRYKKVIGEKDYKKATYEIWKAGYATDPNYPDRLNRLIEQHNLGRFDKMSNNKNKDVSVWAQESWENMQKLGVLQGDNPKSNTTREEAMSFIKRINDLLR